MHATSCGHIYKLTAHLAAWPYVNGGWMLIIRYPVSVTTESLLSSLCAILAVPKFTQLCSLGVVMLTNLICFNLLFPRAFTNCVIPSVFFCSLPFLFNSVSFHRAHSCLKIRCNRMWSWCWSFHQILQWPMWQQTRCPTWPSLRWWRWPAADCLPWIDGTTQ